MNKKAYINPETTVVMVNVETAILAGSGNISRDEENGTLTIDGIDGSGYGGTVNSRGRGLWDDDED